MAGANTVLRAQRGPQHISECLRAPPLLARHLLAQGPQVLEAPVATQLLDCVVLERLALIDAPLPCPPPFDLLLACWLCEREVGQLGGGPRRGVTQRGVRG